MRIHLCTIYVAHKWTLLWYVWGKWYVGISHENSFVYDRSHSTYYMRNISHSTDDMRIHLCTIYHMRNISHMTNHMRNVICQDITWGFICVWQITFFICVWHITTSKMRNEMCHTQMRKCSTEMRCVTHKWGICYVVHKWVTPRMWTSRIWTSRLLTSHVST